MQKQPAMSERCARLTSLRLRVIVIAAAAVAAMGCASPPRRWDARGFTSPDRDATLLENVDAIVEWPERALDNLDRGIENAVY